MTQDFIHIATPQHIFRLTFLLALQSSHLRFCPGVPYVQQNSEFMLFSSYTSCSSNAVLYGVHSCTLFNLFSCQQLRGKK